MTDTTNVPILHYLHPMKSWPCWHHWNTDCHLRAWPTPRTVARSVVTLPTRFIKGYEHVPSCSHGKSSNMKSPPSLTHAPLLFSLSLPLYAPPSLTPAIFTDVRLYKLHYQFSGTHLNCPSSLQATLLESLPCARTVDTL